jgi:hypothetical protein
VVTVLFPLKGMGGGPLVNFFKGTFADFNDKYLKECVQFVAKE